MLFLIFLISYLCPTRNYEYVLIGNRIQFFTDGHKTLNSSILKSFSWYKNIGIILFNGF